MINITKLQKIFSSGRQQVKAIDGVSLNVAAGELIAIVGKSGSGKSTLLALLGALDRPTDGSIKIGDQEVTSLRGHQLLNYRRRTIGFIFQNYNLVTNLSALDNIILPMEFTGRPRSERKKRAIHLLQQVGLNDQQIKRRPGKLSGGEQQRVAIARALANSPSLILADEPTGNLDTQTSQVIIDLLRTLAKSEKTTIIVVTHDKDIAKHADRVYRLTDGKLTIDSK